MEASEANVPIWQERLPIRTLSTYRIRLDRDPVGGAPSRHGELMILNVDRRILEPYTVMLFQNGFYAVRDGLPVQSFALSPFSVLLMEGDINPGPPHDTYTTFSLSIVNAVGFIFAHQDGKICRGWIDVMAQTLRAYTKTFFPKSVITVEPREDKPSTARRIVAGYLLWLRSDSAVSVPFCELQAHCNGTGCLALYENDRCEKHLTHVPISSNTRLNPFEGIDCSVLQVGPLILCARTTEERSLWWRAISNVQVKCFNGAPDPSPEDLRCFRQAILERIRELELDEAATRLGARGVSARVKAVRHEGSTQLGCQERPAPRPKAKSAAPALEKRAASDDTVYQCRRPPPSPLVQGQHAPPCRRALQRATDLAIIWMGEDGQLSM